MYLLQKKRWHIKNLSFQERIWKAEEEKLAKIKIEEQRKKQILQEREEREYIEMTEKYYPARRKGDQRMNWMCPKAGATVPTPQVPKSEATGVQFVSDEIATDSPPDPTPKRKREEVTESEKKSTPVEEAPKRKRRKKKTKKAKKPRTKKVFSIDYTTTEKKPRKVSQKNKQDRYAV
eukprot:TRINITY_DN4921_c0_g1_i1.p1 TRINITY_DN4921_c0_g1~~TRINITY_DN4921_c0_g1_i1.p1  ORF type:complete len:177 (-),score=56.12 TRINITY_DN4921_c0_g1_i1:63-593(-)